MTLMTIQTSHTCETRPGARDCERCDRNYLVVLVCEVVPRHKFWAEESQDWVSELEKATVYRTFGDALRMTWGTPKEKATQAGGSRITSVPKAIYLESL